MSTNDRETPKVSGLEPAAELAIERHVRRLVGAWLKWLGIGNAAVILTALIYIFGALPDDVANRLAVTLLGRLENLSGEAERSLSKVFVLSGRAEASYQNLERDASQLGERIARIRKDTDIFLESDPGQAVRLVQAVGQSEEEADLIVRVSQLERRLNDATPTDFELISISAESEKEAVTRNSAPVSGKDVCMLNQIGSYGGATKSCSLKLEGSGWVVTASARKSSASCTALCFNLFHGKGGS